MLSLKQMEKHLYLNPNIRDLQESPTLRINQRCRELSAAGNKIYRLGLGQSPFPVPDSVVNALRLYAPEKEYLPVQGLEQLRDAVASFHRNKDGVDFLPENIIIGPGSKELLFLLQMIFEGEVIIPGPSWVSYLPQARIIGNVIHVLQTRKDQHWRLMPEDLDQFCRQHQGKPLLLILNYPGNPDGLTYSSGELEQLAAVAARHGIFILSDEIYAQLHHEGKHVSIARFYPEATIVSSGLSKWCGAGGWRLGTFSFPPQLKWMMKAMAAVASETYTSVSAPIQFAAIQAFRCGADIEDYLWHVRKILARIGKETADILNEAGIQTHLPTGAFYLFPDFSMLKETLASKGIHNSRQLCETLLEETGVAILPGADFNRPGEELTARLSYVDFDGAKALLASYRHQLHEPLEDGFTDMYCGKVIQAARLISGWLAK